MQATRVLHDMGQSLWLDNITGNLLARGTLKKYIDNEDRNPCTIARLRRSCEERGRFGGQGR